MPQRQDACDTASPNVLNPSHLESLDQSYTVPYRFGPRRNPMPFRLITTPCGNVCFDHYTKGGFSHASEKEPCADLSGSFQSLTNRLQAHDVFCFLRMTCKDIMELLQSGCSGPNALRRISLHLVKRCKRVLMVRLRTRPLDTRLSREKKTFSLHALHIEMANM